MYQAKVVLCACMYYYKYCLSKRESATWAKTLAEQERTPAPLHPPCPDQTKRANKNRANHPAFLIPF